jgi:hypothetical protein
MQKRARPAISARQREQRVAADEDSLTFPWSDGGELCRLLVRDMSRIS